MAKEDEKDFNAMMNKHKDMPRIIELDDEAAKKWGGKKMIIAPPMFYNDIMNKIPEGKILTVAKIREYIAKKNNADITCPLTAGIFINICAWACSQRETDITPFWRVIKSDGQLNPKYPGGAEAQKIMLEAEGHKINKKGNNFIRYYVDDFEKDLFDIK